MTDENGDPGAAERPEQGDGGISERREQEKKIGEESVALTKNAVEISTAHPVWDRSR